MASAGAESAHVSARNDLLDTWRRAARVPFSGWDFSLIAVRDDPVPWSYSQRARELLRGASAVLDLGTGGGESLAALVEVWPALVVATESWPPNVEVAATTLVAMGASVVCGGGDAGEALPFRDGSFDVVLSRHTAFDFAQVSAVLRSGGLLLSQQIGRGNLDDLRDRFGVVRTPVESYDLSGVAAAAAGFMVREYLEWTGTMACRDVTALVSYLRAVPWELPGFDIDVHADVLFELHEQHVRGESIVFEISRDFLEASWPHATHT